jgi:hypothetical protein
LFWIIFCCGILLLGMLYIGLNLAFEPDPQDRKVGVCTVAWALMAIYLFVFQWLFVPRHELSSLWALTALGAAGYLVGRTWAWLTRWEWIEE